MSRLVASLGLVTSAVLHQKRYPPRLLTKQEIEENITALVFLILIVIALDHQGSKARARVFELM